MELLDIINYLRERPGMHLGEPTLSRCYAFLQGWIIGTNDVEGLTFLRGFQKWIESRYRIETTHSWADIIRFFAVSDVSALTDAFLLIDEYAATIDPSVGTSQGETRDTTE